MIKRYHDKISGPLLDRIDMLVNVQPVSLKSLKTDTKEEYSEMIRARVDRTRNLQRKRYKKEAFSVNAHLTGDGLEKYCNLDESDREWLEEFIDNNDITYRGYVRILKLARTIADMELSERIQRNHLTEAIVLRMGWQNE